MNSNIHILGQKKICKTCGRPAHPFTTKCNYNDLVKRIELLVEANSLIPGLLEANKEAVGTANMFRKIAKDSAKAISICEQVVMQFGIGKVIWTKFQKELEKAWPTSAQDTEEILKDSNPKNTIQNETENKPCTEETTPGEDTAQDSSQSTTNATPAEREQQS